MSEPSIKRSRKTRCSTLSQFEHRKAQLTELYIDRGLTVPEIKAQMEECGFIATQQQYQKRFRCWGLSKNIDPASWKSLSRTLKRYGILSENIDDQGGAFVVLFHGRPLKSDKIKKATYRYDTFLLNADLWPTSTDQSASEDLLIVLRRLLVTNLIRGSAFVHENWLVKSLVSFILGMIYTRDAAERLDQHDLWSLTIKTSGRHLSCFSFDEQQTFLSCLLSILSKKPDVVSVQCRSDNGTANNFRALLQDCRRECTDRRIHILLQHVSYESARGNMDILMIDVLCLVLTMCILTDPSRAKGCANMTDLCRLPSLIKSATPSLGDHLLTILLLATSRYDEPSSLTRLVSYGADPNSVSPICVCVTEDCMHSPHVHGNLTLLQSLLLPDLERSPKMGASVLAILKAGADPNLCGRHDRGDLDIVRSCEMCPVHLALSGPSATFRAIIDHEAHLINKLRLSEVIHIITDPDVLSIILEQGLSIDSRCHDPSRDLDVCPLQAVMARGKHGVALRMLEYIENPLGCSATTIEDIFQQLWDGGVDHFPQRARSESPLSLAIGRGWYDVADKLLQSGADLYESYLDHVSPSLFNRLRLGEEPIWWIVSSTTVAPLQKAVQNSDIHATRYLLETSICPNHLYPLGFSVMTIALANKHPEVIALLRERNAKVLLNDLRVFLKRGKNSRDKMPEDLEAEVAQLLHSATQHYLEVYETSDALYLTVPERYTSEAERLVGRWRPFFYEF